MKFGVVPLLGRFAIWVGFGAILQCRTQFLILRFRHCFLLIFLGKHVLNIGLLLIAYFLLPIAYCLFAFAYAHAMGQAQAHAPPHAKKFEYLLTTVPVTPPTHPANSNP